MSFKNNKTQQITLNDSFLNLTARTQKMIQKSWAADFADIVFPAINEERFSVLYSKNSATRPNTPINFIVGALILKENNNLSDDELVESICCDVRYQYALHTTSLPEQPVSDRTFSRFRERLYNYEVETGENLLNDEMMSLAETYSKYMNLNSNVKRMDSLMVASKCKHMSRLEIIYRTTANAVRLIHRLGHDELLTRELFHYMDDDDYNETIYYCKGDDVAPRLEKAIAEAAAVKEIMSDDEWHIFSEYQLLVRVLSEQSDERSGDGVPKPKKDNDISSGSLQNPSDPDATYRRKAGKDHKGYVGNIVETIGKDGDSLITHVAYEENNHSDSSFCKEYLEKRSDSTEHEIVIADGAYGGTENTKLASEKNTELVVTALTGKDPDKFLAGFQFSDNGRNIISCPKGHKPVSCSYYEKTGMCRAKFEKSCCANCLHKKQCRAKEQSKSYAVLVSENMSERAKYLEKLSTEEYIALTRKRNAVEGVMSVLRRKYRVDEIPTYGKLRSRVFFLFKIGAYNFNKLRQHQRRTRARSALLAAVA